jgi:hypothetical protein
MDDFEDISVLNNIPKNPGKKHINSLVLRVGFFFFYMAYFIFIQLNPSLLRFIIIFIIYDYLDCLFDRFLTKFDHFK